MVIPELHSGLLKAHEHLVSIRDEPHAGQKAINALTSELSVLIESLVNVGPYAIAEDLRGWLNRLREFKRSVLSVPHRVAESVEVAERAVAAFEPAIDEMLVNLEVI